MEEYFIFKKLSLAVSASFLIWYAMKRVEKNLTENLANPIELKNGDYAIKKPENKYAVGVDAPIETKVKFK